jgi:iron uptake system EfeUOB component EfeO/EfeM
MDKNLEPFRSALSAVKELDTKVKDAVKEAFAELRDQLTTDIDNRFSGVESRLATIEQCTSFDQAAVQRLVESEIRTLKNDLEVQLETKVRHMIGCPPSDK